jgi:hypothetical protein
VATRSRLNGYEYRCRAIMYCNRTRTELNTTV